MILSALFAAQCLLPAGPYQAPRQVIAIEFATPEFVHEVAIKHGIKNDWKGVEWGFNHEGKRGVAELVEGDSKSQSCSVRHMLGHFHEYETTGNLNPRHVGWEYQE